MRPFLLALLLLPGWSALPAQWRVAVLSGTAASHGDARDEIDPAHPEIRADGPATVAVALTRERGSWRLGWELHRTSADLAEISASAGVSTRGVLTAWGAAFDLARRIAGRDEAPALHLLLGAGIDRWTFALSESAPRWRGTARGAVEAGLPINPAWSAVIRGQATAGPSVFTAAELPEGFAPRTALRIGIVLGVSRRL